VAHRKILYKAFPNTVPLNVIIYDMPGQTQRGGDSIAMTHSQLGARRRRVFNIILSSFTSGKDPVPIVHVWEDGKSSRLVWTAWNTLPPPEFDPQTFQSVSSCYTDYAIPTTRTNKTATNIRIDFLI
jgi:hypothetical protein